MFRGNRGGVPAALLLAAVAAAGDASGRWADVAVLEQRENATVALLVVNRAPSDVALANCVEEYAVPAGGNVTLSLAGLTGFWVVPAGVQWDCHKGPFNLFSLAANLTGPDLVAAVGYGLPEGRFAFLEDGAGHEAAGQPLLANSSADEASRVTGVELGAGADGGKAVRCRAEGCSEGYNLTSVPDDLTLTIMGPQVSLLSFWFASVSGGGVSRVGHAGGVWRGGVWHAAGGGSTSGGSSAGGSASGSSGGGGSTSGSGSSGGSGSSSSGSNGGGSTSGSYGGGSSHRAGGGAVVVSGGGVWHGGVHTGGVGCMFWCRGRCRC